MSEQSDFGGLKPEIVKKPAEEPTYPPLWALFIPHCPKCGSTTFDLITNIDIVDMLTFDDETGNPFIQLMNVSEALDDGGLPHRTCQRVACSECGEPIPKEWLSDLPDQIENDVG